MTISQMLESWIASIVFFPSSAEGQAEIGATIQRWLDPACESQQIEWLHSTAIMEMAKWQGIGALRAIFLRRFPLPKGIEQWDPDRGTYYLDGSGDRPLLKSSRSPLLTGATELEAPDAEDVQQLADALARQSLRMGRRHDLKHTGPPECRFCRAKDRMIVELRHEIAMLENPPVEAG